MGKYARKAKVTVGVAVMDVSQSYLGVRTRAKTLALQRLQSTAAAAAPSPPPPKSDDCYLELRSRRLQKPMQQENCRIVRRSCGCGGKEEPEIGKGEERVLPSFVFGPIEEGGLGIEASFGENNLDFEARGGRGTRESTPCSLIRTTDTILTPGSTTKQICSTPHTEKVQNAFLMNVPCARELEEFFARMEQPLQRHFMEKYNFDFVKELPLAGRYEWVSVRP